MGWAVQPVIFKHWAGQCGDNLIQNPYKSTYYLLGLFSLATASCTFWAAGPSWTASHMIGLLPWLPWTSSPYIALAAMVHITRQSNRAAKIVLFSSILFGIFNSIILGYAIIGQKQSGELWLVVPLYELLACIPISIVVLLANRKAKPVNKPDRE